MVRPRPPGYNEKTGQPLASKKITPPKPKVAAVAPHKISVTPAVRTPARAATRPVSAPARYTQVRPPRSKPRAVQQAQPVVGNALPVSDPMQEYIDAIIGPGREQLDYLRQQQMQADQQRLSGIKGLTDEFMQYLSKVPGQVQGDYSTAISQQMNMGREAQQALAAASTNPQVQADLQTIGAPEAQQAQVADKLGQTFEGGGAVLLGTGGQIPAQQLSSDQAAQLAFVRSLPAVAAATGQQTLRSYLQQSQGAYNDINQQYSQLLSQVPKMRLDFQSQLADQAAKQQQLDLEYKALGLKRQGQAFNQSATTVRLQQGAQRIASSNEYRFAEIYGYNPKTGQPTLQAIKAAKADKKKANKPVSASALKNWNLFAEDAYRGVKPKTRYDSQSGTFIPIPPYVTANGMVYSKAPLKYYPALKKLLAMGASLAQAQKVLNALYAKGEGYRPWVSLQGRVALQKAGMPLSSSMSQPNAQQLEWLRQHGLWGD